MPQPDHPTQPYAQLPPGNGAPLPTAVPGYQFVPYQQGPYGPVPVVPPQHRGPGFWVGITAAIATGVILALLAGFFIGRGTRLSNSEAQSKITQQAQADQIVQQKTLSDQKAQDQATQDKLVTQAAKNGESRGLAQGRIEGQQAGYQAGQSAGFSSGQAAGQAQGQAQGLAQGQQQGFSQGQAQGFSSGVCSAYNLVC